MESTASGSNQKGAPLEAEHVYVQLCADMEQYLRLMRKCVEVGLMNQNLVHMQEFILRNLYLEAHKRIPKKDSGSMSLLEAEGVTRESWLKRKAQEVATADLSWRTERKLVQISKALEDLEDEDAPRRKRRTLVRVGAGAPSRDASYHTLDTEDSQIR